MTTKHDLFEKWKSTNPIERWSIYWMKQLSSNVEFLFEKGFWVIPLGIKSKRPLQGYKWLDQCLTKNEALLHVGSGGNLGVVAGLSKPKLTILDLDSKVDFNFPKTLTSESPNGKHFFTLGSYSEQLFRKIKEKYNFDLARSGSGYVVLPLSETCRREHQDHPCPEGKHDYHVHIWEDQYQQMIPFRKFVKDCL